MGSEEGMGAMESNFRVDMVERPNRKLVSPCEVTVDNALSVHTWVQWNGESMFYQSEVGDCISK